MIEKDQLGACLPNFLRASEFRLSWRVLAVDIGTEPRPVVQLDTFQAFYEQLKPSECCEISIAFPCNTVCIGFFLGNFFLDSDICQRNGWTIQNG